MIPTRPCRRSIAPLSALLLVLVVPRAGSAELDPELAAAWERDLDFVVEQVRGVHPAPWRNVSEEDFTAAARELRAALPELSRRQVVARVMALVARIGDGHTHIEPVGEHGFLGWFPIRMTDFSDGLFVTVAPAGRGDLLGARVLEVGSVPAEEALKLIGGLVGADNAWWRRSEAAMLLSSPDALVALGILESDQELPLRVRTAAGAELPVSLPRVDGEFSSGWFWRQLRGPGEGDYVTPFPSDAGTPLHLRHQKAPTAAWWLELLPGSKTLYAQINGWWDRGEEGFAGFNRELWETVDREAPRRIVLDLRYNAGGNGALFDPMLHEIIRRPEIDRPDRLFVLIGRRTFSASVLAVGKLVEHTRATLVGEPMGAPLNAYGDARSLELPESGLALYVSEYFWQAGFPTDDRTVFSPHVPAPFASADFFAGRDPALDGIERDGARSLLDLFESEGAAAALAAYERYAAAGDWWLPASERELNSFAYRLLRSGRTADARAAFELNSRLFPDSWNVWDSFGEALLEAGELDRAAASYRRSLELNPGNGNARDMLDEIAGRRAASD